MQPTDCGFSQGMSLMQIANNRTAQTSPPRLFVLAAAALLFVVSSFLLVSTRFSIVWTIAALFVFSIMAIVLTGGVIALVGIRQGRLPRVLQVFARWSTAALYPVAVVAGRLAGLEKDRVRGSFIEIHNQLAAMKPLKVQADEILLLLPHCLQWADCPHRITIDVNNCRQCGKCVIGDLLELQRSYGFHMAVATGGTLARKIIADVRPSVVVAVACERDLAAGIQDVRKIHVIGILNERPSGPCYNTTLNVAVVEDTIRALLN